MVFLLPATALAVPITVPTSLSVGDQYRLAFVTSSGRDATSSDIADYNSFVTNATLNVPELAALGTTWKAIASTASVDARDNTGTNPSVGAGVPIFLLNDTKLVDDNADLWDGDLDNSLSVNQFGSPFGMLFVWTGTTPGGIGYSGFELGPPHPVLDSRVGDIPSTNDFWISFAALSSSNTWPLYALSDTLTVPIPEPSTLVLFGLGFLGLVGYVYRRMRRLSD